MRHPDDKDAPSIVRSIVRGIGGGIVGLIGGFLVGGFLGAYEDIIRTFFWAIGVEDSPVRYLLGTKPEELTPSDLVFLEMMPRSKENLHDVVRVQVDDVSYISIVRLLATALLASEEAGALRLEMVKEKVAAVAVGSTPEWPTGSLESELCKHGTVSDIIFDWIGASSGDPKSHAVKRIMERMVNRTLMEADKKRVLKLFTMTSRYYVVPEGTSALVMQRPVRLLEACQRTRPDVHGQLTKDIEIGFAGRIIEYSDDA